MSWVCCHKYCPEPARKFPSKLAVCNHQAIRNGHKPLCHGAGCEHIGIGGLSSAGARVVGGGLQCFGAAGWTARLKGRVIREPSPQILMDSGDEGEPESPQPTRRKTPLSAGLPQPPAPPPPDPALHLWPTPVLRMTGPLHVWPPAGRLAQDSGPTSSDAGRKRGRELRLSPSQQLELTQLLQTPPVTELPHVGPVGPTAHFDAHDQEVLASIEGMNSNPTQTCVVEMVSDPAFGEVNGNKVFSLLQHLGKRFRAQDVGFTSMADLRRQLGKHMPKLTGTDDVPVIIAGLDGQPVQLKHTNGRPVLFAHHNLWHESLDISRDPLYQDQFVLRPQAQFNSRGERVWSTFRGGLLFEQMQASAPPGYMVIAPILASDEATFLSRMSAYPIYCE